MMDNWDECISLWSASLSRGGIKSKRTCEEYKRYLIEFLNRPGLQSDPGLVTEARVTEYCFSVDHKGLMPSRGLISMRIASCNANPLPRHTVPPPPSHQSWSENSKYVGEVW